MVAKNKAIASNLFKVAVSLSLIILFLIDTRLILALPHQSINGAIDLYVYQQSNILENINYLLSHFWISWIPVCAAIFCAYVQYTDDSKIEGSIDFLFCGFYIGFFGSLFSYVFAQIAIPHVPERLKNLFMVWCVFLPYIGSYSGILLKLIVTKIKDD